MKKHIFIFLLFTTIYSSKTMTLEQFETEFFNENESSFEERQFLNFMITPQPKVFKISDIPFYIKLTAVGFYESKIKPAYYALIAYIKSFQRKK